MASVSAAATPPEVCHYEEAANQRHPHALIKGTTAQANLHMLMNDFQSILACRSVICQSIELKLWI